MKILLYVPCWHRPEIVELFVKNIERTPCDYAEVIPFFVLSEEDPDYTLLTQITQGYNRTYTTNTPLGRKKNEGLKRATALSWDYFMDMGSDDIYTVLLWRYLKDFILNNQEYFGILNTYAFNPYLNQAVYLPNYHIGFDDQVTAQGQGRCIRRDVVERCMPLWDNQAPFGMDGYSDERITTAGYKCQLIDNGLDGVVCQIKTNICLTAWEMFEDCGFEACDVEWVKAAFGLRSEFCFDLTNFDSFHTAVLRVSNETDSKEKAFNLMNEAHKLQTGNKRYSSYDSYKVTVSRKFKQQ
jgi:hypothetical protein